MSVEMFWKINASKTLPVWPPILEIVQDVQMHQKLTCVKNKRMACVATPESWINRLFCERILVFNLRPMLKWTSERSLNTPKCVNLCKRISIPLCSFVEKERAFQYALLGLQNSRHMRTKSGRLTFETCRPQISHATHFFSLCILVSKMYQKQNSYQDLFLGKFLRIRSSHCHFKRNGFQRNRSPSSKSEVSSLLSKESLPAAEKKKYLSLIAGHQVFTAAQSGVRTWEWCNKRSVIT